MSVSTSEEALTITDVAVVDFGRGLSLAERRMVQSLFRIHDLSGSALLVQRRVPPRAGQVIVCGRLLISPGPFPPEHLLAMYLYCNGVSPPEIAESLRPTLAARAVGIQEIRWLLEICLISEFRRLLHEGLAKRYVYQTEQSTTLRGRIDWARSATTLIPISRHAELTPDDAVNGMLFGLVLSIKRRTTIPQLVEPLIRDITEHLAARITPRLAERQALEKALANLSHRLISYRSVLVLAISLLNDSQASTVIGDVDLPPFYFDLSHLFERFVGRLLSEGLAVFGATIDFQLTDPAAFVDEADRPYAHVRPDFLISRDGGARIVVDAKFKRGYATGLRQLTTGDLFQVAFYCRQFGSSAVAARGFVAAPLFEDESPPARMVTVYHRQISGDIQIQLLPIPMHSLLQNLLDGDDAGFRRERDNSISSIARNLL